MGNIFGCCRSQEDVSTQDAGTEETKALLSDSDSTKEDSPGTATCITTAKPGTTVSDQPKSNRRKQLQEPKESQQEGTTGNADDTKVHKKSESSAGMRSDTQGLVSGKQSDRTVVRKTEEEDSRLKTEIKGSIVDGKSLEPTSPEQKHYQEPGFEGTGDEKRVQKPEDDIAATDTDPKTQPGKCTTGLSGSQEVSWEVTIGDKPVDELKEPADADLRALSATRTVKADTHAENLGSGEKDQDWSIEVAKKMSSRQLKAFLQDRGIKVVPGDDRDSLVEMVADYKMEQGKGHKGPPSGSSEHTDGATNPGDDGPPLDATTQWSSTDPGSTTELGRRNMEPGSKTDSDQCEPDLIDLGPKELDATNAGQEQFDTIGARPKELDTTGAGPKEVDTTGAGPKEVDTTGAGPKEVDTTGAGPKEVDTTGVGPKELDTTGAGPKELDTPGAGPKELDTTGAGPKEVDTTGAGPKEKDTTSAGPKELDTPGAGPKELDTPGAGPNEVDTTGAGPKEVDTTGAGPKEVDTTGAGPKEVDTTGAGQKEWHSTHEGPKELDTPDLGHPQEGAKEDSSVQSLKGEKSSSTEREVEVPDVSKDVPQQPQLSRVASVSDIRDETEVSKMSVHHLKNILQKHSVRHDGLQEKSEIVDKVKELWRDIAERKGRDLAPEDLCKICMTEPIDCVLLECGHMPTCIECGNKIQECPMCRQYIDSKVHLFHVTDDKKGADDRAGTQMCRICHTNRADSVLIPCGHVVACYDCADDTKKCPYCTEFVQRCKRIYQP